MSVTNTLNITDDGLQDFDSTTGDFTAIALTTKGDLLGHDGTDYQRFPIGTDGYVLKADSTQTVGWRWACTNFEFLSSATASNSSSIEFTSFADAECFSGYRLVWSNVTITGGTRNFRLRFSIDNGTSWLSSDYMYCRDSVRDDTGDEVFPSDTSADSIYINGHTGDSSTIALRGEGIFYPSADPTASLSQGFQYESSNAGGNSQYLTSRGFGTHSTTSQINAFQFTVNTGNLLTGTFQLYGVLEE